MPVSKTRKNHKKKVQARNAAKVAKRKKIDGLIQELQESMAHVRNVTPEAVRITGQSGIVLPSYDINPEDVL